MTQKQPTHTILILLQPKQQPTLVSRATLRTGPSYRQFQIMQQINRIITKRKLTKQRTRMEELHHHLLIRRLHCMNAMKRMTRVIFSIHRVASHFKMLICHQVWNKRTYTRKKQLIRQTPFMNHQVYHHQNQSLINTTNTRQQQRTHKVNRYWPLSQPMVSMVHRKVSTNWCPHLSK